VKKKKRSRGNRRSRNEKRAGLKRLLSWGDGLQLQKETDYVVTAEDLPVPDELLRRLPPHLPWRIPPSSHAGLGRRIRRAEVWRAAAAGEERRTGEEEWRRGAGAGAGRWPLTGSVTGPGSGGVECVGRKEAWAACILGCKGAQSFA
jgi:hypothetical protein